MNGAELLIRCLEAEGVDRIWGYPGGAIMPVYDALLGSSITHHLVRHEQGAAFAAQGHARSTGRVGVCMATSGPGATNLVTGIADAAFDSVPMVAITGQVPMPAMGSDAFQEVDIIGITLPIVKHSFIVRDAADIPRVVREAFRIAAEGRPGPVLIDFPKNVGTEQVEAEPIRPPSGRPAEQAPDADEVVRAIELIRRSERPVIYAGGGVNIAGAEEELRRFVDTTGIPVVHTLKGLGAVPNDHPHFLGMLGMHGLRAANRAVQESDLLIAIGARFDDRVTGKLDTFAPGAAVVHMDIDAAEIGKLRRAQASLRGDLAASMRAVTIAAGVEPWTEQCVRWKAEHAWPYDAPFESVYAPRLIRDLSERMPERSFVTCDVGQHQMWVAQHFRFRHVRQHLTSAGLGTMGFGLPAAIGAQAANPDACVVCVSGDGSFMMNVQELATIRRCGLPVKIVLLDNSALGMVRQWQELFFQGRESEIDLSDNPDFGALAGACGIPSRSIQHRDEASDALDELLRAPGPMLLHVRIDRHANVWPLVPPGASNSDMLDEQRSPVPRASRSPEPAPAG